MNIHLTSAEQAYGVVLQLILCALQFLESCSSMHAVEDFNVPPQRLAFSCTAANQCHTTLRNVMTSL